MTRTARQLQGDRSRQKILEAAGESFRKHGYKGSSLATIAESAGITQAGLLHHFPSKAELLLQLVEHHYNDEWFPTLPSYRSLEFLEVLSGMIDVEIEQREATRLFWVLANESLLADHPTHEFFVERYRRVRELLRRPIKNGQYGGTIDSDIDADQLARLIVAVLDGLVLQWLLDPEIDMAEAFRVFSDLLERAVGVPPEQQTSGAAVASTPND